MVTRAPTWRVAVLHPDNGDTTCCALRFTRRGVELALADPSGLDDLSARPSRIPWWSIAGFSADAVVALADGRVLQRLDVVTDAGTLTMVLAAPDVGSVVGALGRRARRWRRCRRRLVRAGCVRLTLARGALAATGARALATPRRRIASGSAAACVLAGVAALALLLPSGLGALGRSGVPARGAAPGVRTATRALGASRNAPSLRGVSATSGMAAVVTEDVGVRRGSAARLARATAPAPPAPPAVAAAPPLSAHEVFGFVPYWALAGQAAIDVGAYTTLAYFAVGVRADGSFSESGPGWIGFQSQALADLVARAHAAGARVVLTVNCFTSAALEELTSSPAAASTLATQVVGAIESHHLDGVNVDFEGLGASHQAGLTALVARVSRAVHAADAHFQVTVDVDGSSAGDPSTFYDVRALAQVADGLFVMAYGLNFASPPTAASPVTSTELSDAVEAGQYAAAVPPSKVIFGTSFFGYSWKTTNGTMAASATGTGAPVTVAQVAESGRPMYWDPVTETAWTSYRVDGQWYEDYVPSPASVSLVSQLVAREGFGGVGVWAVGMDGGGPRMTAALDGRAQPVPAGPTGPAWTPPSKPVPTATTTTTTTNTTAPTPTTTTTTTPTTTTAPTTTTTTTTAPTTAPTTTTSTTTSATTTSSAAAPTTTTTAPRAAPAEGPTLP